MTRRGVKRPTDGLREAAVGRRVRKEFGGDLYDGSVVDFKPSKGWYLVRYDDGDSEDLFWKDLEQILVPSPASETDPAAAGGGGAPARGDAAALPGGEGSRPLLMPTPPPRPPATEPKPSKPRTSAKGGRKASKAAQSPLGDASSAAPPLLADPVAGWTGQAEVPPVSLHASLAAERGGAPGGAKAEACIREYNRLRLLASEEENERVASSGGKSEDGKKKSRRPDLVAMKKLKAQGGFLNNNKVAGDIPGISVGFKFWSRAEMACVGLHFAPVAGIDFVSGQGKGEGYVTSIVLSGNYEGGHGDENATAGDLVYDGAGGCDLLHDKRQIADQTLDRGNLAFTGNFKLQIPVRVTRKNKCPESYTKSSFTYDGLWNVVDWWSERPQTEFNSGFLVYRYRLRRRPGQPVLGILTKAEEKIAEEVMRQAAKEKRAEEKAQREEASKREKEVRAVLQEVRQTFSQATGGKRKTLKEPQEIGGCKESEEGSGAARVAKLQRVDSISKAASQADSEPRADNSPPPTLMQPPHRLTWQDAVSNALSVADFLSSFWQVIGLNIQMPCMEDLPGRVIGLAVSCADPPGHEAVEGWLVPAYKALLLKALPCQGSTNETASIRTERWQQLLNGTMVPFLSDHLVSEILRRSGCIGRDHRHLCITALPAQQHIIALNSLCNTALGCLEVRRAIDGWLEQQAEACKEFNAWTSRERRRLQELECEERKRQEEKLAASQQELRTKMDSKAAVTDGIGIEEVRQLQREAKDLADLHGKLRAEARQQVAHVVSEASKESAAACEQRLREAEAKVSGMAVRRLPLGYDRNGSRYWWIPMLDSFVLLEDSDGRWIGYFDRGSIPSLTSTFDPSSECEQLLSVALGKAMSSTISDGGGDAMGLLSLPERQASPGDAGAGEAGGAIQHGAANAVLQLCLVLSTAISTLAGLPGDDAAHQNLLKNISATAGLAEVREALLGTEEKLNRHLAKEEDECGSDDAPADPVGGGAGDDEDAFEGDPDAADHLADRRHLELAQPRRRRDIMQEGLWPEGQAVGVSLDSLVKTPGRRPRRCRAA